MRKKYLVVYRVVLQQDWSLAWSIGLAALGHQGCIVTLLPTYKLWNELHTKLHLHLVVVIVLVKEIEVYKSHGIIPEESDPYLRILKAPAIVTDSSPLPVMENLHPPFQRGSASYQSKTTWKTEISVISKTVKPFVSIRPATNIWTFKSFEYLFADQHSNIILAFIWIFAWRGI